MEKNLFLQHLLQSSILTDVAESFSPALSARGLAFGFSGTAKVQEYKLHICVGIPKHFPRKELVFFLLNQNDFQKIPHAEEDGYLCYTSDDSLVLDIDNATGIIQDSFELVTQTILKGISGQNSDDFYNEYEAYWARIKNQMVVFTNLAVSDQVEVIKYTKVKEAKYLFASSADADRMNSYHRLIDSEKAPPQFQNGLYIPLLPNSKPFVPDRNTQLTTAIIRDLISRYTSTESKARIEKALFKTKTEDVIIFSLPQPNGNFSLFGVRFKNINHKMHPLVAADTDALAIPLSTKHLDPEYMTARGGTGQAFSFKKVLIIGAGSVGSAICEEVVKAGIPEVHVIDKDTLEPENCYRHACGFIYVSSKKADAVKKKLESFYPHCKVIALNMTIEDALDKGKVSLPQYDAIIVATGNATINQYLNETFRKEASGAPVLFSWLDPYAIGGHCLLSNLTGKGCYQCLYQNDNLHNTASFSASIQPKSFSKNISGCSSMYIPYGSLDAVQTAILTVRTLLDVFQQKMTKNAIFSWKGNPDLFLSEGYHLSGRFYQSEEQLYLAKHLFYQPNCRVCGNK